MAYVFRLDNDGTPADPTDDHWVEEGRLTTAEVGGVSGATVAMDGDFVAVGAPSNSEAALHAGAVFVFRRDDADTPTDPTDDSWTQDAKLTASDAAIGDHAFGTSVAVAGDRLVVGDKYDTNTLERSGSAYIFRRDDNDTPTLPDDDFWTEEAKLTASETHRDAHFGSSVAISGHRVLVGAPLSNLAYIYRLNQQGGSSVQSDALWVEEAILRPCEAVYSEAFGISVALSGDTALVGAVGDDCISDGTLQTDCGAAHVFRRDDHGTPDDPGDDSWHEEAKLTAPDASAYDNFGFRVALERDRAIIGTAKDDADLCNDTLEVCRSDDDCTIGSCVGSGISCHTHEECPFWEDICMLPADPGKCAGICPMYFFNPCTRQCELFQWGCCGGNGNRFETLEDCEAACPPEEAQCLLEVDFGIGDGEYERYYYDTCTQQCEAFVYRGDGGNANNFLTQEDCDDRCPPGGNPPPPNRCLGGAICGVPSGSAYLFRRAGSTTPSDPSDDSWIHEAKLLPSDATPGDRFGTAVSILGEWALVGAPTWDREDDTGTVYAFRISHGCESLADFARFQGCFPSGKSGSTPCDAFDYDADGDVDLKDFDEFVRTFAGP